MSAPPPLSHFLSLLSLRARAPRRRALRPRCLSACVLLLLALAGATSALAHPFGRQFFSARSTVELSAEGLDVLVVVEIPATRVLREFVKRYGYPEEIDQTVVEEFTASLFATLAEDLALEVDGERIAGRFVATDHPKNGRAGEGFFVFMLRFEPAAAPLRLGRSARIVVDNQVYPGLDREFWFSGLARAQAPWRVVSSNAAELVGELPPDVDFQNDEGAWTRDAALRRLEVRVVRADS